MKPNHLTLKFFSDLPNELLSQFDKSIIGYDSETKNILAVLAKHGALSEYDIATAIYMEYKIIIKLDEFKSKLQSLVNNKLIKQTKTQLYAIVKKQKRSRNTNKKINAKQKDNNEKQN